MTRTLLPLLLPACAPPGPGIGDTASESDLPFAVVVSSDYTVGTLGTMTEAGELAGERLPTSGDSVVVAEGARVFLLDRAANVVRAYDEGQLEAPSWETNVGDGANPVGVATCGGRVFVSRYFLPSLLVLDVATGLPLGSVDLSAFDDGDGSPEAESLIAAPNGKLYVTLNQLDYLRTFSSADGSGTLLEVDCQRLAVTRSWDTGPSPRATPVGEGAKIALFGGDYFTADRRGPALDGGLWVFDTAAGTLGAPLITDASAGGNVGNVVLREDGLGLYTVDDGFRWTVNCFDSVDGRSLGSFDPSAYVHDAVAAPDGAIWLVQRSPYAGEAGEVGFVRVDPTDCSHGEPVRGTLEPYGIAFPRAE